MYVLKYSRVIQLDWNKVDPWAICPQWPEKNFKTKGSNGPLKCRLISILDL